MVRDFEPPPASLEALFRLRAFRNPLASGGYPPPPRDATSCIAPPHHPLSPGLSHPCLAAVGVPGPGGHLPLRVPAVLGIGSVLALVFMGSVHGPAPGPPPCGDSTAPSAETCPRAPPQDHLKFVLAQTLPRYFHREEYFPNLHVSSPFISAGRILHPVFSPLVIRPPPVTGTGAKIPVDNVVLKPIWHQEAADHFERTLGRCP